MLASTEIRKRAWPFINYLIENERLFKMSVTVTYCRPLHYKVAISYQLCKNVTLLLLPTMCKTQNMSQESPQDNSTQICNVINNSAAYTVYQYVHCTYWYTVYDTDVAHYNFNTHQPILIIFGRDVAGRICYRMAR